jgi:hypothetical protein
MKVYFKDIEINQEDWEQQKTLCKNKRDEHSLNMFGLGLLIFLVGMFTLGLYFPTLSQGGL